MDDGVLCEMAPENSQTSALFPPPTVVFHAFLHHSLSCNMRI